MNLFLIGWSPRGDADAGAAEASLRDVLARLAFFDPARIQRWRAPSGRVVLACVTHEAERVGGRRYVALHREEMALYSGRPFRWTGDEEADGRGPLDAEFYRRPCAEWMNELDGRCVAARYDDREGALELYTDPLGAYPVFWGERAQTRWISNSAELVRTALGAGDLDLSVLAGLLGGGWSLRGQPAWAGVRRLPRGVVHALRADGPDRQTELLGLERIAALPGAGFDARRAARLLVAATGALADWPGRPNTVQLSGGRDSRLVFAAALAAGVEFTAVTAGAEQAPDVRVARDLCASRGVAHRRLEGDPEGMHRRSERAARVVGLAASGTISLEHAAGYPLGPSTGALALWLNGQGGEIAGGYYGTAAGLERDDLLATLLRNFAGATELLSARGRELVHRELGCAIDEQLQAGVAPGDVLDVFYLVRRMGCWAAAGHGCVEYAKGDTTAPLWSRRLLADQLGAPRDRRSRDRFYRATLHALDPQLSQAPFAHDTTAPAVPGAPDIGAVVARVREAIAAQGAHQAWEVLDRRCVAALLQRDAGSLGDAERRHVWRLATVFLGIRPEGSP